MEAVVVGVNPVRVCHRPQVEAVAVRAAYDVVLDDVRGRARIAHHDATVRAGRVEAVVIDQNTIYSPAVHVQIITDRGVKQVITNHRIVTEAITEDEPAMQIGKNIPLNCCGSTPNADTDRSGWSPRPLEVTVLNNHARLIWAATLSIRAARAQLQPARARHGHILDVAPDRYG